MEAALSIAAPAGAAPTSVATVPTEAEAEGGFAAALTRSLAGPVAAAPAVGDLPAPGVALPASSAAPVPGTAAAAPLASPVLAAEPGLATELAALGGTAPPNVLLPTAIFATPEGPALPEAEAAAETEAGPEAKANPPNSGEAIIPILSAPTSGTPKTSQPGRSPKAGSGSADESAEPEGASEAAMLPAAAAVPAVPSPTMPVDVAPKYKMGSAAPPGGMAPPAAHPGPEAAGNAVLPEASSPAHPLQVGPHGAHPDPLPPATAAEPGRGHAPLLAPELAALQVPPRAFVNEAAPAHPAAPSPSPARQVSSVAVALAFAPGGSQGFNLTLEPAELGRVEIQVQRDGDNHSVRVVAERPETLALLQRDRQELDRGLAEAGLRVDARGIDFSLETQSGGSGFGREPEAGRHGGTRGGPAGGPARPSVTEREAPPPRLSRGLLDLNI